jgi:hypothetical protein
MDAKDFSHIIREIEEDYIRFIMGKFPEEDLLKMDLIRMCYPN